MNYANYAVIHSRHLADKVCLIERTPSKNERRTLTWHQFNDEINKSANYLSNELGIKDGDFVMHLQNNSLDFCSSKIDAPKWIHFLVFFVALFFLTLQSQI